MAMKAVMKATKVRKGTPLCRVPKARARFVSTWPEVNLRTNAVTIINFDDDGYAYGGIYKLSPRKGMKTKQAMKTMIASHAPKKAMKPMKAMKATKTAMKANKKRNPQLRQG